MTHLLVNNTVMDSLRKDIMDLQAAIIDIFSRVGALRYPSWKFPNKVSCDLDLVTLLEHYDYVEGDAEFTKHAHVVLLELVIDRLLLLLQSFTCYTETLSSEKAFPPSRVVGPSTSIGLAARKYWSNLLHLGALYEQASNGMILVLSPPFSEKQTNSGSDNMSPHPATSQSSTMEHGKNKPSSSQTTTVKVNSANTVGSHSNDTSLSTVQSTQEPKPGALFIAKDTRTIGSQTFEASLVPCDACASAQASLQEVNNTIISVCSSQNLPSSLCKFQEVIQDPMGNKLLSAMEMRYWASEQSKDLVRINKHLSELIQVVSPLKTQLEASEKEKQVLKQNIEVYDRDLQRDKEEQQWQMKLSEQRMEEKAKESQKIVYKLEKDKDELTKGTAVLEERVSILKEELKSQHSTIQKLELAKEKLLVEMRTKLVDKKEVTELSEQVKNLTNQLETTGLQLRSISIELEKERARGESLVKHEESLQEKQKALLKQLDSMDLECEELRNSAAEMEEDKTSLEEQLNLLEKDKQEARTKLEKQQEMLEQLQQEKQSLENTTLALNKKITELEAMIQERKEREKLLVAFPDLHIPAQAHVETSGNITEDMQLQLQANCIRISVLEEENGRLRAMLSKLKETAQQGSLKIIPQTQLWGQSGTGLDRPESDGSRSDTHTEDIRHSSSSDACSKNDSSVDRVAMKHSASSQQKASSSEALRTAFSFLSFATENTPIGNYARLKRESAGSKNRRPMSSKDFPRK